MPEKKVLFYTTPSLSSFSKKDIQILSEKFNVRIFVFNPRLKIFTPLFFLKQIGQIFHHLRTSVYVTQFGGYHSLIPAIAARILGRKSYIITGGTDCVSFPLLGYGNFARKILGLITCISFRLSGRILPVHESLVNSLNEYDPEQPGPQGMLTYCKGLTTPYTIIHNGYNAEEWTAAGMKNPFGFITVAAGAAEPRRYRLKGLDLICEIAEEFPHCMFTIVGTSSFSFEIAVPANVILIDFADQKKLLELFRKNKYYLQLSISEGFPNAICEAMLCECIPIGSPAGALKDIIDSTGLILEKRNLSMLSKIIHEALALPAELGVKARNRISGLYSLSRRRNLLLSAID